MPEKQVITGTLENWYFIGASLVGGIYGDINKRFKDGTTVRTSNIEGDMSKKIEGSLVQTRNSLYKLGRPFSAT